MADIKIEYAASSNLTVTNLASLGTSSTWTAGWTSAYIDNSSNKYQDYLITGKITTHNTTPPTVDTQIYVRVYAELDDSTAFDLFSSGTEGTEGAATVHDVYIRDSPAFRVGAIITVDATTGQAWPFEFSVKRLFGQCPRKFALFVAHNTGQDLHSSGHQITHKGIYYTG